MWRVVLLAFALLGCLDSKSPSISSSPVTFTGAGGSGSPPVENIDLADLSPTNAVDEIDSASDTDGTVVSSTDSDPGADNASRPPEMSGAGSTTDDNPGFGGGTTAPEETFAGGASDASHDVGGRLAADSAGGSDFDANAFAGGTFSDVDGGDVLGTTGGNGRSNGLGGAAPDQQDTAAEDDLQNEEALDGGGSERSDEPDDGADDSHGGAVEHSGVDPIGHGDGDQPNEMASGGVVGTSNSDTPGDDNQSNTGVGAGTSEPEDAIRPPAEFVLDLENLCGVSLEADEVRLLSNDLFGGDGLSPPAASLGEGQWRVTLDPAPETEFAYTWWVDGQGESAQLNALIDAGGPEAACLARGPGGVSTRRWTPNAPPRIDAFQGCERCTLPKPGLPILSELMVDPTLFDGDAEWFEFYNPSDEPISLDACTVVDDFTGAQPEPLEGYFLQPRSYIVFRRDADPDCNGGVVSSFAFTFNLNNGGDTLSLVCDGEVIFSVTYPFEGVEIQDGYALNYDHESGRWCNARTAYSAERSGAPDVDGLCANELPNPLPQQFGTPGQPNHACP